MSAELSVDGSGLTSIVYFFAKGVLSSTCAPHAPLFGMHEIMLRQAGSCNVSCDSLSSCKKAEGSRRATWTKKFRPSPSLCLMYSSRNAEDRSTEKADGHIVSRRKGQHLQVIDRDVGRFGIQGIVKGLMPQVFGQVGQAGDEVQAPGGRCGRMHGLQRFVRIVQRVRPPTHLQQLLAHMQSSCGESRCIDCTCLFWGMVKSFQNHSFIDTQQSNSA